jgi:serine/threonine protein kinase
MAPKSIGRFELISELGAHPLGVLYKANDPKRGHVALLAIEASTLTPESRQQVQQLFSRARTAALLNSPNIASVYGGGEADGYVFLSMEFVDGVTLRTAIARDGRMSTGEVIDIARQLCTALDHAQSKGVVHQNLHPGNIKVEWDGAIKLMDYGLDLPDKRKIDDPALHYALRYASPEQLRSEQLTSKSNLYTLGAVLYELVTGARAVTAEDPEPIRNQVLHGEIVPPMRVCNEVRQSISDAILKAMSGAPGERYESAAALVREFETSNRPSIVKPKTIVPIPAAAAQSKPNKSYGGPNTSAIFKAMQDNFSHSRTAIAERPTSLQDAELPPLPVAPAAQFATREPFVPPAAQQYSAPMTPPVVEEAVPVKETVYEEPGVVATPAPKATITKSIFDVVEKVEISVREKAKAAVKAHVLAKPAASEQKPASEMKAAVAKPPAMKKAAKKSPTKVVLPDTRKMGLIAAGMLLAVGLLWGVSRYHSQSTTEAATPQVMPQPVEQTAPVVAVAVPETPVENPDDKVTVRHFGQKKKAPVVIASAPAFGDVVVTSIPEGAQIQIDGRSDAQWVTPRTMTGLTAGEHVFHISKPGYTTMIKTVALNAGDRPIVSVALQQIGAILSVTSEPAGAMILVDGKESGKVTPAQVSVSTGSHQIALRKDGYFEFSGSAVAQNGQTVAVAGTLMQAGRTDQIQTVGKLSKMFKGSGGQQELGRVRVKTSPKGAYILVNGKPAPDASPSEFMLNPGMYEITMQLLGFKDVKRRIRVDAGRRVEIDESLEQR